MCIGICSVKCMFLQYESFKLSRHYRWGCKLRKFEMYFFTFLIKFVWRTFPIVMKMHTHDDWHVVMPFHLLDCHDDVHLINYSCVMTTSPKMKNALQMPEKMPVVIFSLYNGSVVTGRSSHSNIASLACDDRWLIKYLW